MTEVGKEPGVSWLSVIWSARHDPAARILNVDLLAVLVAILLPWSTSGVSIALTLWLIALAFTVEPRALAHSLTRPACALPIAFFALALLGVLWSDAPWSARLHGVSPFAKFLALPLIIYHFERSSRGMWVFIAFLMSCTLLMLMSWIVAIDPGHGGDDTGALGYRRLPEADIVLAIAKKLKAELEQIPGVSALLTRSGDYFIPLRKRMEIARKYQADIMISIHCNASRNRDATGTEVYFLSLTGATDEASRSLAESENAADLIGGGTTPQGDDVMGILFDLRQNDTIQRSSDLAENLLDALRDEEAKLARELQAKGARVIGFGGPGDLSIDVTAPDALRGLVCLPALQLLGERVALHRGIDSTAPRHLTKVVLVA